ncbi:MAG: hypothetical protein RLN83_14755 [Balneola sp.]
MDKIIKIYIIVTIISAVFSGITLAQGLSSEISLYKILVNEEQQETLIKADEVEPADLLEYQILYANNSSSDITALQPVLPIPTGLQLITEDSLDALVSVDGVHFFAYPIMKTISKEDQLISIPIDKSMYRFLKWKVDRLEVGKEVTLKARMSVL